MTSKKNEEVEEFTEDAVDLQRAKVALLVCALGATSAVFQIAAARPVLTLLAMQKLDSESSAAAALCFLKTCSYGLTHYLCL